MDPSLYSNLPLKNFWEQSVPGSPAVFIWQLPTAFCRLLSAEISSVLDLWLNGHHMKIHGGVSVPLGQILQLKAKPSQGTTTKTVSRMFAYILLWICVIGEFVNSLNIFGNSQNPWKVYWIRELPKNFQGIFEIPDISVTYMIHKP